MPIALSYVRFSSPEQADGDSERRQREAARSWAASRGFPLDESYETDKGLSAFSGSNLRDGSFSRLMADIRSGKIARGSWLLVESLDRITRQPVKQALKIIDEILDSSINIFELSENTAYTPEDEDFGKLIVRIVRAERSHNESEQKSQRISKAWAQKKHHSAPGVSITNKLPGWLEGKTKEPIRINPDKAKVVRQIFEWSAQGLGKRLIARRLNVQGVPTFGDGKRKADKWGQSYVQKLLFNRGVLGEFQPFKISGGKRVPDGDPRFDFFPAVVASELWNRAHASISSRHAKTDKGQVTGRFAGQTGKLHNLFTGLIYDANYRLPMHYQDKGAKSRPRLVTNSRDTLDQAPNSILYSEFETAFLGFLSDLDWKNIAGQSESDELIKARTELNKVSSKLDKTLRLTEKRTAEMDDPDLDSATVKVFASQIAKAQVRSEELEKEKINLSAAYDTLVAHADALYTPQTLVALIRSNCPTNNDLRLRLRSEIRRRVEKIGINFSKTGSTTATIVFVNGARKAVIFKGDSITLAQQVSFERPEIVPP